MADMKKKDFTSSIKTNGHNFTATITTSALDRDNEVLLPMGMRRGNFDNNPVVFWNHDYDTPIGKAVKLNQDNNSWSATAELVPRPKSHRGEWFPDTVHQWMKHGAANGVSVGFIPIETRRPSSRDKEKFGDDVEMVHSKWDLLEFSVTPIPCNQEALINTVSKGYMTKDQAKKIYNYEAPERKRSVLLLREYPLTQEKPKVESRKPRKNLVDIIERTVAKKMGRIYFK